jgi:hypothetical protein
VINVHGGRAGYHPGLYKAHLAEWMDINNKDATTGASDASKKAAVKNILRVSQYVLRTTHVARSCKMSWTMTF